METFYNIVFVLNVIILGLGACIWSMKSDRDFNIKVVLFIFALMNLVAFNLNVIQIYYNH